MQIFAGVPLGAGVKQHWGLSTTAIFGDLAGYVFENFRDMASNIMWQYAALCDLSAGNWLQDEWPWRPEWPWVAISWPNPSLASTYWLRVSKK